MEKENNSENNNTVEAWELNPKKDGCCLNCTCKWYVKTNGLLLISQQKIFSKIFNTENLNLEFLRSELNYHCTFNSLLG